MPLIERYRDRLPVEPGDPVVTLLEGSTPLVPAPRLSERLGDRDVPEVRGHEPDRQLQGPRHDRRRLAGEGRGRRGDHLRLDRQHGRQRAAYAARAGMRGAVIVPEGKIARGKLAQALMHGARVIALRGNFDQALELVKQIVERHPVELVNSINPYRIEGQKTAAFEVCDELGAAPDALAIPVGNAGNVTAWWKGFERVRPGPAAPVRLPGRGRRADRAGPAGRAARRRSRRRSGSATRLAGRRRSSALDESGGRIASVSDDEILEAQRWLASTRGRVLRAGVGGVRGGRAEAPPEGAALLVCVLTGHGLKDPETAIEHVPGGRRLRPRPRRGRAGGARTDGPPAQGPRARLVGEPRTRLRRDGRRRLAPPGARGGGDGHVLGRRRRPASADRRDATSACGRSRTCTRSRGCPSGSLRDPARRPGSARAAPRSSRRCSPPTTCSSWRCRARRSSSARRRSRGIPTTSPPRSTAAS